MQEPTHGHLCRLSDAYLDNANAEKRVNNGKSQGFGNFHFAQNVVERQFHLGCLRCNGLRARSDVDIWLIAHQLAGIRGYKQFQHVDWHTITRTSVGIVAANKLSDSPNALFTVGLQSSPA